MRLPSLRACGIFSTLILAAMLAITSIASPGCSIFNPSAAASGDPKADPVVVSAQATLRGSFAAIDSFITVDDQNRDLMRSKFPAVHAYAESLRASYPGHWRSSWQALDAWKAVQSPAAGDKLQDTLRTITALADQARTYLITLSANGLKAAPTTQPKPPAITPAMIEIERARPPSWRI